MSDWRSLEQKLVEWFKQEGYRPEMQIGQTNPLAGDWIVRHGNRPINVSKIARDLSVEMALSA